MNLSAPFFILNFWGEGLGVFQGKERWVEGEYFKNQTLGRGVQEKRDRGG